MQVVLDPKTREFYRRAITTADQSGIPFLVGGAYALERYTKIERHTKDFDIFIKQDDVERFMEAFASLGYRAELTFPHWLGKVHHEDAFIDFIYRSGNGVAVVDDAWFEHAEPAEVLGLPVRVCPAEEILWTKALIMERERYDGADVAHLLLARAESLDWPRLLGRFGPNWRVLLAHLILFGYIFPGERSRIPEWVMRDLLRRQEDELALPPPEERVCRGTILSRAQYLVDVEQRGYQDVRLRPLGTMTPQDVARWTADIEPDDLP